MHENEKFYAFITRSIELVLCAPALALKPIFYTAALSVEASKEEQESVTHAPRPDWSGLYQLPIRGESWTFVSWFWWFAYWVPISLMWFWAGRRLRWL